MLVPNLKSHYEPGPVGADGQMPGADDGAARCPLGWLHCPTSSAVGTEAVGIASAAGRVPPGTPWPGAVSLGSAMSATTMSTCLLYTSPSPRDRQKSRM